MSNASGSQKGAVITWGPLAAILVTIATYILSQLIVGLVLGLVFGAANWPQWRVDEWLDSTVGQAVVMSAGSAVTLMVLWLFLDMRKGNFRALGLIRWPKWTDAAHVAAGFFVYFVLFVIVAALAGTFLGLNTEQEQEIGFESVKTGGGGLILVFISLVILPPIVEELLFRGFLFGGLRKKLTLVWATLITSAMFAAPHLLGSSTGLLWIAAVDTFVLSLVLCYVRERTGALWACIGIHAVKNGLAFLYLFVIQ